MSRREVSSFYRFKNFSFFAWFPREGGIHSSSETATSINFFIFLRRGGSQLATLPATEKPEIPEQVRPRGPFLRNHKTNLRINKLTYARARAHFRLSNLEVCCRMTIFPRRAFVVFFFFFRLSGPQNFSVSFQMPSAAFHRCLLKTFIRKLFVRYLFFFTE